MSTHTIWMIDVALPDCVCFVDSSHDSIRARYVNENDVENREAELTARWEAAIHDLQEAQTLVSQLYVPDEYKPAAKDFLARDYTEREQRKEYKS